MLEGWARPRPAQEAGRGLLARPPSARLQSHCFLEVSSPPPVAESCLRTRCSGPPGGRKPSSCWPASSQRPRACSRAHPLTPWVLGRCWAHGPQLQWEAQAGQAAQSVGSCPGAQTTAWGEGTLSLPWPHLRWTSAWLESYESSEGRVCVCVSKGETHHSPSNSFHFAKSGYSDKGQTPQHEEEMRLERGTES